MERAEYSYDASPAELERIRVHPGRTSAGKSFDWYVNEKAARGEWRLECIRADVLGLQRPLEVYRAVRKTGLIRPWKRSDREDSYCPAHWADLRIGRGACGLRCRGCFLLMTHRVFCDPSRHVLYENVRDYVYEVRRWLQKPDRRNLGLGIDCSDSLLYEGVTGHARRLVPIFASDATNPHRCGLFLLTKSANVRYLEGLPTENVRVTFSLNPERIADLWEGKFQDGFRVTPPVARRLEASLRAQEMGFEIRWRLDPIFPVPGWQDAYAEFLQAAVRDGHRPTRITLGTYRETQASLRTFAEGWGLLPVEWARTELEADGDHYHLPRVERIRIYNTLTAMIREEWRGGGGQPIVALCKEPLSIRRAVGLQHDMCNCG
jgi:DNA repair photolyase